MHRTQSAKRNTHSSLGGIFAAALTPMDQDLNVDHGAFAEHCRRLLAAGCHGLGRRERLESLKRDREAVLETYANVTVEALEVLSPEERNKLYKILKLRVVLHDDGTPEVSGVFCGDLELPGVESFAERNATAGALST